MITTPAVHDVIAKLNNYRGDNIWQDVIYSLDIDEDATDEVDEGRSDVFCTAIGSARTIFRFNPQNGQWQARA